MKKKAYLQIKDVTKHFSGVTALKGVSIDADAGVVTGLLGVNGAGKSTLMNIIGGLLQPDQGEIIIDGKRVVIKDPGAASKLGIAFIQQEIQIFENLMVFENIFITELSQWKLNKALPFFDVKTLKNEAKRYLDMLGLDINVTEKMGRLSVGEQQMVQIARALSQGGKILLFDEPTSSLTNKEKQKLFETIRKLKDNGLVIFYITHHLDEVYEICDHAIILRDGELVGSGDVKGMTKEDIVHQMLGKDVEMVEEIERNRHDEPLLEVKDLSGIKLPKDISFTLYRGEILGVWGLLGSGRTELVRCILGLDKTKSKTLYMHSKDGRRNISSKQLFKSSAYLTEGRHYDGLFINMSLWINSTSTTLKNFSSRFLKVLNNRKERKATLQHMESINVKAANETMYAKNLSGGNQQKIILIKWFMRDPEIFFLDEPTKGVDVGAKAEIQNLIFQRANEGKSFVIISSEFEEIMALSDRILIMNNGRIIGEVRKKDFTKERLMAGIVKGDALHE